MEVGQRTSASDVVDVVDVVRRRLTRFLQSVARGRAPLIGTLRALQDPSFGAILFGGLPRDLVVLGGASVPRDVDVVVQVPISTVEHVFRKHIKRRTRFGGLHLNVQGWHFDVWSLSDTWAFQQRLVEPAIAPMLPRTTFLNAEAIAVELYHPPGRARRAYEGGLAEAVSTRTLNINFEPNPYPALCVVRSILIASKLGFRLSPRLLCYIATQSTLLGIDELISAQIGHYGTLRRYAAEIRFIIDAIKSHLSRSPNEPLFLPSTDPIQLALWDDET